MTAEQDLADILKHVPLDGVREMRDAIERVRQACTTETGIPPARLRAMMRLLGPEEMTPTAQRQLESLCEEYENRGTD